MASEKSAIWFIKEVRILKEGPVSMGLGENVKN